MSNLNYLRLFSIVTALLVGFWLPLKMIGIHFATSIDVFFDLLISAGAAVNIYIHFRSEKKDCKVWQQWLSLTVILDLICLMPLMLIETHFLHQTSMSLVFFNLLTARHIWKIKDFLDEFDNLKPIVFRLVPLAMMMPLLVHLLACGWILLGNGSAEIDPNDTLTMYVKAIYWAMTTLTTVGYGDIVAKTNPQMLYAATTQLVGVGVFGFVLSNVASLLSRLDASREHHMDNLDQIESFMMSYNIPIDVKSKVRSYYHYVWKEHKGRMDKSLLDNLPAKLQSELNLSINQAIIERVSFLKTASRELLEDIMLSLDHRVFVPGERIFRAGEPGTCLYLIHSGQIEITTGEGQHIAFLNEGSVFGEIALISDGPRTASARAKTYCDLYVLEKAEFDQIISAYPDFKRQLESIMAQRQAAPNSTSK